MPVMTIEDAVERRQMFVQVVQRLMVKDSDYGRIPGTDKDTLLKPGAEKLTSFFGLSPIMVNVSSVEDWTGENHKGEPFFYFRVKCQLYRGELLIGEGEGSCNSWEKKYRYRASELLCPDCQKPTVKKSKFPPKNDPSAAPGWYCFAKIGGCGAEFDATDKRITEQPRGLVPNPDVADVVNTVLKMANKRALVAATLVATNASEFFTQDVEDMDFGDGPIIDNKPAPKAEKPSQAQQTTQRPAPAPASNGNGKKPSLANQIKTAAWKDVSYAIAQDYPEYANPDGTANIYHILHALEQEGVTEITAANVQTLPSVIAKHLAEKNAQPA